MKIKLGLLAVSATLALGACSSEPTQDDPAAPAAPAVETAEDIAARVKASLSPLDYALRVATCNQALITAQRAPEGAFNPELTAKVANFNRLSLGKTIASIREVGGSHADFNRVQHAGVPLPQRLEDVTPDYVAQAEECLPLVEVEYARQQEAK